MVGDSRRHHNEFGKSSCPPIVTAGDSENFSSITEIHLAATAKRTLAAINCRIERDAVAALEVLDSIARTLHYTGGFVTHHERRNAAAGRAVKPVNIAAANATGCNANKNLI